MNILFIGYWGVNEGLSVATIEPHLEILSKLKQVRKIIYTSIERHKSDLRQINIPKVQHIPLYSGTSFIDKFNDYFHFPKRLATLCRQYQVDIMICRGAPAGALGYLVWRKNKIPFYVESFEPHADYMRESGVWSVGDPRYWLSRYWEEKQKKYASGLMPVAENYRKQLIREGISDVKIKTVPCTVDIEKFSFDPVKRSTIRQSLKISDATVVGIYVGKYGGIYMDEEAFQYYQQAFKFWEDFFLIILSPEEHHQHIRNRTHEFSIPKDNVLVTYAKHEEVPSYLSASDFAFATIKPAKSRKYCSAIKIGEYWANGLPIVMPKDIGDDSNILTAENAGTLIEGYNVKYSKIDEIIKDNNYRSNMLEIALRYRNRNTVIDGYGYFLKIHSEMKSICI